jgi:hypothetical protein
MEQVRDLFKVGAIEERKYTVNPGIFRLSISCNQVVTVQKISNYFQLFPLKTSKSKNLTY